MTANTGGTAGARGVISTAAELTNIGLAVTPQNVLQMRNVLAAEVDRLREAFRRASTQIHVGECGGDPLSKPVAEVFNRKITAYLDQSDAYVNELAAALDMLHQTALSYGHTETDIAQSFTAFSATLPAMYEQVRQDQIRQAPDRVRDLLAPPSPPRGTSLPGMFGGLE